MKISINIVNQWCFITNTKYGFPVGYEYFCDLNDVFDNTDNWTFDIGDCMEAIGGVGDVVVGIQTDIKRYNDDLTNFWFNNYLDADPNNLGGDAIGDSVFMRGYNGLSKSYINSKIYNAIYQAGRLRHQFMKKADFAIKYYKIKGNKIV